MSRKMRTTTPQFAGMIMGNTVSRLVYVMALGAALAHAQITFRYFYDGNHQLFRVLDSTGNLLEYDYDLAGNPAQIKRSTVPANSLSILNIVPSRGTAGQTITIYGQNFSSMASGDVVKINGVIAEVISATSTTLVVLVPAGVATGPVTVTVGGVTAASGGLDFVVPALPTITSISPNYGNVGQNLTGVTVQGTNLTGAAFNLACQGSTGGTITNVNVASSTQATFNLTPGPIPGPCILIANANGGISSSVATSRNTFQVLYSPGENYVVSRLSVFNTYTVPGGVGAPTGSFELLSVFNTAAQGGGSIPTGSFQLFSTQNNCTTCPRVAPQLSIRPVTVAHPAPASEDGKRGTATPAPPAALIAGQTVGIGIAPTVPFTRFLEFDVDGVPLASSSDGSLSFLFTVPHGQGTLELLAGGHSDGGMANAAEPQRLRVVADPGRTISGRVSDVNGNPMAGARLIWQAHGLTADYYSFSQPLSGIPDLTGRQPTRSGYISALNFPNPANVFGKDPIGTDVGENYAARFHGTLLVDGAGEYQFLLRTHQGARLLIDGTAVAEATASGEFSDATGAVSLVEGHHEIEVVYYESGGATTLELFWTKPGGLQEIVPPSALLTDRLAAPAAVTTDDGRFHFRVPAILDGVQVELAGSSGSVVLDGGPQ